MSARDDYPDLADFAFPPMSGAAINRDEALQEIDRLRMFTEWRMETVTDTLLRELSRLRSDDPVWTPEGIAVFCANVLVNGGGRVVKPVDDVVCRPEAAPPELVLTPSQIAGLLERSSLGTPGAKALRARTPSTVVAEVKRRVAERRAAEDEWVFWGVDCITCGGHVTPDVAVCDECGETVDVDRLYRRLNR